MNVDLVEESVLSRSSHIFYTFLLGSLMVT